MTIKIDKTQPTNKDILLAVFPELISVGTVLVDENENIIASGINYNWLLSSYKNENVKLGD